MFTYIILNYNNVGETLECLSKLKRIVSKESKILVVDNNTLNKDDELLINKYNVDILKLDKNYGFSKANNKGVNYVKKIYNPDFYVVMNNDVYITDEKFEKKILNDFKKYNFDMLGSKIFSPSGESVNPFPCLKTKDEVKNEIIYCKRLIKIYNSKILFFLLNVYLRVKKIFKNKNNKKSNGLKLEKNVPLHGCCITFSKKYINKYEYAFFNETFLFHEEEFIYQRVVKDKLISVYDPKISIFHKEGSSIKKKYNSIRKNKLFREKERLKSLELLYKQID